MRFVHTSLAAPEGERKSQILGRMLRYNENVIITHMR